MTKTVKKTLLVTFLTLFFVVCACFFAACGGTENNAVKYSVTVTTDETTAASGVRVTVGKGGATLGFGDTNANGKVEFELVPDNYEIKLSNLPQGYTVAEGTDLTLTAEKHDLTVKLAALFSYKISLVNPDGTPYYAQGVMVGVCTSAGCQSPVAIGTDGVAHCIAEPDNYHVQIMNLPATAAFEHDASGYYNGPENELTAEITEITITIYPAPATIEVTEATPMTSAQKTAYAAKNSSYTADEALTAYHFEKTLAAYETAYYSITPAIGGEYVIYKDGVASYLSGGMQQRLGNQGHGIYSSLELNAGTTYYFNVSNAETEQITAEFVLQAPAASTSAIKGASTVDVTIVKEGANAVIELTPTAGASYKLTAQGTQSTSILQCNSDTFAEQATHADGSFAAGKELSVKFTEDMLGYTLYFSVAVKGGTYPASFQIKVEKIADLKNTTTVVETEETLAKFADETEKHLAPVPFDGTLIYNTNDHFYHLGTADGPVVVVMLTKKSDRTTLSGGLIYLEENNQGLGANPYLIDTTSDADKADLTKGNTYKDYRRVLRGFDEYDYEPNGNGGFTPVKPTTLTQKPYYAKFVNSDGVYPLTKELEAFLKGFAANNTSKITGAAEGSEWLFACYYYTDEEIVDPGTEDAIVGVYVQEGFMGANTILTVKADETFTIVDGMGTTTGLWGNNGDGTYMFITDSDDPFFIYEYTVTRNAQTGGLKFHDDLEEDPDYFAYEFEVYVDPVVGNYTGADGYTLTVNADGTYAVKQKIMTETTEKETGTWEQTGEGAYTFTVDADDPFFAIVYTVTRNAFTGALTWVDTEMDNDEPYGVFEVDAANTNPIVGEYSAGKMGPTLTVSADGTFTITENGHDTTGIWVKEDEGKYTFTTDSDDPFWVIPYDVTRDEETGALTFMDGENPAYEFEKVAD